jgi:hypothetical protein
MAASSTLPDSQAYASSLASPTSGLQPRPWGLDYKPPEVPSYDPKTDIPANALDAKDFPSIDAWLDACVARGLPGKIGSGTYVVDGQPREAPAGIYGYGDTPPKFVAENVDCWLYLKDQSITLRNLEFEGFGQPVGGFAKLSDGAPYHSTTKYYFNRFQSGEHNSELEVEAGADGVGPGIDIAHCVFRNCENAFTFVSDTTKMGKVEFHGNELIGTYGILDIDSLYWTEVNAANNEWRDATGARAQPDVKQNGVQTGFKIGTDYVGSDPDHFTKLSIVNNYAHNIESVGTYRDTNAAVFADVRGIFSAQRGDNEISYNEIVSVKGLLGQEDSNAIYAKAFGLVIEGNRIVDTGAAYYNARDNGSETSGIIVKPVLNGLARDIEIVGNTFEDMPLPVNGSGRDLAVVKLSEAVGHSKVSFNTFIESGNTSSLPSTGVVRVYGDIEKLDVIGNTFVDTVRPGNNPIITFHSLTNHGVGQVEVSNNSALKTIGTYSAPQTWIAFNGTPKVLITGHNTLEGGFTMGSTIRGQNTAPVRNYEPELVDFGGDKGELDLMVAGAPIAENIAGGTPIGLIGVTTTGSNRDFTFTLVEDAGGRFSLNGATLIATGKGLDFESARWHDITILVRDGAGNSHAEVFRIEITNVDEPATDLRVTALGPVAENSAGIRVANLTLTDPDVAGATYSVDDARFEVKQGGLWLKAGQSLNFEAGAQVAVTVRATDGATILTRSVTLQVSDADEPATGIAARNLVAVAENVTARVKVADLTIDDPDTTAAFATYSFTTNDARFEADATGLWLKAGNPLDFEALPGNPVNVTVTATRNGQSFSTVVPVQVSDVVEQVADLIARNVRPLTENGSAPEVVADLSTVGFGPAPGPSPRVLSFAATEPVITVDDDRFEVVDSQLRLKAGIVLDFETTPQIPVTITASHGGTSVTKTIVVSVTDINEAPLAILATDLQPLPENLLAGGKVADLTVIDPDTNPAFRAFTYEVSDARFEVKSGALFLKAGQAIDFEALSTNPIAVTVKVSDGAGSVQTVVPVTILDVNEGGSEGDDRGAGAVRGTTGADTLFGLGGHDELFGLNGSDRLYGGQGDDRLIGGQGADLLDGGAGFDIASYRDAAAGVRASLHSSAGNTGEAAGDTYFGIEGLEGSAQADILTGNNGANDLFGGRGSDHISGMGGADRIFGGEGDDVINGQGGNDVIDGGAGNDILSGGLSGRDWFVVGTDTGRDRILDFEIGTDILDFRGTGLSFDDLVIRQVGADALVSVPGGGASVLLLNKLASSLAPSDTLF